MSKKRQGKFRNQILGRKVPRVPAERQLSAEERIEHVLETDQLNKLWASRNQTEDPARTVMAMDLLKILSLMTREDALADEATGKLLREVLSRDAYDEFRDVISEYGGFRKETR